MRQRIILINLPHLAESAPTKITVSCVFNVGLGDGIETARCVEPGSDLMGIRLVLDKTVLTCRLNSSLIQVHCVQIAPLDASDLRQYQRLAITIVLRTVLGPKLELLQFIPKDPSIFLPAAQARQPGRVPSG